MLWLLSLIVTELLAEPDRLRPTAGTTAGDDLRPRRCALRPRVPAPRGWGDGAARPLGCAGRLGGAGGDRRCPDSARRHRRSQLCVAHPRGRLRIQPQSPCDPGIVRRQRTLRRDRRRRCRPCALPSTALRTMESFQRYLERVPGVGYSLSPVDIMKGMRERFNELEPKWGVIPSTERRGGGDLLHLLGLHPSQHERALLHARLQDRPDHVLLPRPHRRERCAASSLPRSASSPSIHSTACTSVSRAVSSA